MWIQYQTLQLIWRNQSVFLVQMQIQYQIRSNTKISSLPNSLQKLKYLHCGFTPISSLPDTYINLETLDCFGTNIESLPDTYVKLKRLYCFNDYQQTQKYFIENEPVKGVRSNNRLPNGSYLGRLRQINIPHNIELEELCCSYNQIINIPEYLDKITYQQYDGLVIDKPEEITESMNLIITYKRGR